MNVKERIAYVRGLIEGSEFYGKDTQAKAIWESLLRICDDLADTVRSLEAGQQETDEYVEAIDSDLADVESELYGFDDDDDDGDADDDASMVEMECPNCGEEVYFEEDFLYDTDVEISCPECGGVVYATGTANEGSAGVDENVTDEVPAGVAPAADNLNGDNP